MINNTEYHANYQKIMQVYSSLYIICLLLWIILMTLVVFISLKIKEQDIMKWRIMGFSNRFVIKQTILEILIPMMLGILMTAVFLIVCQHTYEYLLIKTRPLLSSGMGIKQVPFFSSQVLIESTPNAAINKAVDTHFLSMRISSLSVSTIFNAFSKNCLLMISLTTGITLASTSIISRKSKKVFRT